MQRQLAQACDELQRQLRAGAACRAEDLLAVYPAVAADTDAALELVYTEFVVREELGQQPQKADWLARFPQWRDDLGQVFDVHTAVAISTPGAVDGETGMLGPGSVIGPYKLLEELGEGGFGVVYLAEQRQPVRRKVALKVLKAGTDRRQVIARFEAERQALALMDHPNIARVFDGGTIGERTATTGDATGLSAKRPALGIAQPYFVMELVKGVSITAYCQQHGVAIRDRLGLFVDVCQAVQHAHQKGIIHRDLKPSNVLVTLEDGRPRVKVIDFGIAKALGQQLTDKTLVTGVTQLVGTPLYMAPEQAAMSPGDVDTRTDIYSLGVLLYELLTGTTPFSTERLQGSGYEAMRRIICEEEPPRPSTRLQNRPSLYELDWIVMRCLEKDRNRRYETASALAADVRRYLHNEPVSACPPSAWYRLRKFAGRHKGGLAIAACAIVAVTAVAASIGWALRDRAARAADIERTEQERELTVRGQVRGALDTASTLISENQLTGARLKLAEARAQLGNDRSILDDLAREMDAADAALDRFQQFRAFIDRAHQAETAPLLQLPLTAQGAEPPSDAPSWERRPAAAVPLLIKALDHYEVLKRNDWYTGLDVGLLGPAQVEFIRRTAYEELLWLADDLVSRQRDHDTGLEVAVDAAARRALAYLDRAETAHQPTRAFFALRARCHKALHDESASSKDRESAAKAPPTLALDLYFQGQAAYDAKNLPDAVQAFEAALRLEPTHYWSLMRLGACWCDLGQTPEDFTTAVVAFTGCIQQRPDHAHPYYCRGVACDKLRRFKDGVADFTKAIALEPTFAAAWSNRGYAQRQLGDARKAVDDFSRAIALDATDANVWNMRGAAYLDRLREPTKALDDFQCALKLDAKDPRFWTNLGNAHADLNKLKDAIVAYDEAIRLEPNYYKAWYDRGNAHLRMRRLEEALADFTQAIKLKPDAVRAWLNRGIVHDELRRPDQALADFDQAIAVAPGYAGAWYNRGATYHKRAQFDKALADYAKAGELKLTLAQDRLAWLLATCPEEKFRDGRRAVAMAKLALAAAPRNGGYWQTLAWAHYRASEWQPAVTAMEKVKQLGSPGDSFEWFLLAMAHWRLGNKQDARRWYDRAVAWMDQHAPTDPELRMFRTEATQLLGLRKD
jgi:serine/threonine protein kinase/tetratricopeptide (TPR) repeat protein